MITPPGPFDYELHTIRWALFRLMEPNQDLETLCTYAPRLVNAAVNVAKINAALKSETYNDPSDKLHQTLRELLEERLDDTDNNEEDSTW